MCSPRSASRPTSRPSVQSEQRTDTRASRPCSSSSSERSEEAVGEGHVCTHCRAQQHSSSSKVCNGRPLFRTSLVRKVDRWSQSPPTCSETVLFAVFRLYEREESWSACFRTCVGEMKRLRNASGNATSKPYASVGLSPTQIYTFLVSFPLFSVISTC